MQSSCYSSRQPSGRPIALITPLVPVKHAPTSARPKTVSFSAVASQQAGPVLVHDGAAADAPASPQQLLAEHRRWSYTTALVRQGHLVVDWDFHLERLVRNIQLLGEKQPPVYSKLLTWFEQHASSSSSSSSPASLLDNIIRPQVTKALQLLAAGQQQQQDGVATVLVTDSQGDMQASPAGTAPPLSVYVWAKYLPPAGGPLQPAKVLVAGDARATPQAKHCDWVIARQPLEQLKQALKVDEVVLSDSNGALLEGLVSNWYVIADKAALAAATVAAQEIPAAAASSAAGSWCDGGNPGSQAVAASSSGSSSAGGGSCSASTAGLVLLTTGHKHAALPGVSQRRVLQACQQIGLRVVEEPAQLAHCAAWREAFISNCVKGIQPVTSVQMGSDVVWHAPYSSGGAVTQLLQQAILQLQQTTDMSTES